VSSREVFPTKPHSCPKCYSGNIKDIEVLGAYNGPLFWECEVCGVQLLRFSRRTTNKHLSKLKELHFDLEGLDTVCEGLPN